MSTSAVSSQPKPVTFISRAPGKPCGRIQDFPQKHFPRLFSCLCPAELALLESVHRTFCTMIRVENQTPWKDQCLNQNLAILKTSSYIQEALSSHSVWTIPPLNDLIADYAINYKDQAVCLRGRIELYRQTWYLAPDYIGKHANLGPFASIRIRWSMNAWPVNLKRMVSTTFPSMVPLSALYHPDQNPKNNEDEVHLIWKGKPCVLTCTHEPERCDDTTISNFREGIAERVRVSVSVKHITQDSANQAKATAAVSGEWTDLTYAF